jgi:ankyrin repeat protein
MNYYEKYLKYKTKYLNLLKGGAIPHIDCDLLPLEKNDINIIFKKRIILKNNDDINNNYLLNDNYQFEKINIQINKSIFNTSDWSMLANLNVKLGREFIPFHVGSLQFHFNIIIGIIKYIEYPTNADKIKKLRKVSTENSISMIFTQYVSSKIFDIPKKKNSYTFLGITNKNSILNCFSFFNKLHEFLNYILLNEYNETTINKLFPNIENIKDFYNIYHFFYLKKEYKYKDLAINEYLKSTKDKFYDDIELLKEFIDVSNNIDNAIEFKSKFGISLINLVLINWIYLRSLTTNLVVGTLSSNLYPINKLNFLEDIFQMNEEKIYCYAKQQEELKKEDKINNLLLERIEVPIISYGQSTYKGHDFSNCVENTILQLLKILAWKGNEYKIDLLPNGISEDIKNIIIRINQEPLKIETKKIMDDFVVLLSGIDTNIAYRFNKEYNIESNIENIGNILNYVFNGVTVEGGIEDYSEIFNDINTDEYNLKQDHNIITIDKNFFKINIIINNGHVSIEDKNYIIYDLLNTYEYLNIIYTFNYTKDDSINFDKKFINFCKEQVPEKKNFLTDKIINIQKILLKEPNSVDEIGNTCLHIACILDNSVKLNEYLGNNYADMDIEDNDNKTPLLLASEYHHIDCMKLLIKKGDNINYINTMGLTPLLLVLYNNSENKEECLELLIEKGVDINKVDEEGNTPILLYLSEHNIKNKKETINLLIKNCADINHINNDGNTALILTQYDDICLFKFLIKKCIKHINYVNDSGHTALTTASQNGNFECIKLLIDNKADVNPPDSKSALGFASTYNNIECVKLLIENNANINNVDSDGNTPLIMTAKSRYNKLEEYIKLLIDNKADINYVNNQGISALSAVSLNQNLECLKLLIENKADVNNPLVDMSALTKASSKYNVECVKLLIDNNADINYADSMGITPLISASRQGYIKNIQLLIDNKSDVNHADNMGNTPLLLASSKGYIDSVKLLIDNKADIIHADSMGNTPLLLASMNGYIECIQLLIDNKSDINHANSMGNTPLLMAFKNYHKDCIKLLIKNCANVKHINNDGDTILKIAVREDRPSYVN